MTQLVLSVCPGLDILGMGFEDAGYCVVRGGEPMFGQRGIEGFHPPAGKFDGVIGGPPCQMWATPGNLHPDVVRINLIPEFERVVLEAQPAWFLMENVTRAPIPLVDGYEIVDRKIYAWELGNPQRRYRRFTFGGKPPVAFLWPHGQKPPRGAVTLISKHNGAQMPGQREVAQTLTGTLSTQRLRAGEKAARGDNGKTTYTLAQYTEGFGLPEEWDAPALLKAYKFKVLGNAVPLQVARALAEAVIYATQRVETR